MADDVAVGDFSNASQTLATKQISSRHFPYTTELGIQVSANFTRPSNATAYTAGDVVDNSTTVPVPMTFSGCARANGLTTRIESAVLNIQSVPPAAPPNYTLYIFDTAITAANDNAAWSLSNADSLHCLGVIPFVGAFPFAGIVPSIGNNMIFRWEPNGKGLLVKAASADTALYGLLQINSSHTPTSAAVYTVTLNLKPE